jgi:molybdate transport system permease protein
LRAFSGNAVLGSLTSPAVIDALWLSAVTTSLSVVVIAAIGLPLAVLLARGRLPGGRLVETIVDLPIVLPPSVAGLALLLVFGRRGLIGGAFANAGWSIAFTTAAVVVAQVFVAAPFFIRSARAGIATIEHELEDAARVDGAAEHQVLRWITLPLAAPALGAGLVMCWARALGEFGATIMFAGNVQGQTQTLPLVVYGDFQSGDLDAAIAAAAVLVVAAVIALIAVRGLGWRRALDTRAGA